MAIIGNQKAIKLLNRIVETGKIANAYLFLGPESVGKFTAALEFAKKLAGENKINSDLIIIGPEIEEKKGITKKLDIKVEAIRDLQHKLSMTSSGGKYKVVIIDEAERLNKTAQNAMLKTLEEPNANVVLILVSQSEKKMLPTIISRCQKIRFNPVAEEEMKQFISKDADDKEILFWSLGRPGLALSLVNDPGEMEFRRQSLSELRSLFTKNNAEKFSLADGMSKDISTLLRKINLWTIILRESMLGKSGGIRVNRDKALKIIEKVAESMETIRGTNSNPKLVLENLFLSF